MTLQGAAPTPGPGTCFLGCWVFTLWWGADPVTLGPTQTQTSGYTLNKMLGRACASLLEGVCWDDAACSGTSDSETMPPAAHWSALVF